MALIPHAFSGAESMDVLIPEPLDEEGSRHIFVADAFSNPAHVQFALRGTLAAMVCYITYTALDWPGLSTSVLSCFITALSTIGSSRQKQVLRLSGAAIGGFIFGMGAQVFVLPYLDGIAGFICAVCRGDSDIRVDFNRVGKAFLSWRAACPRFLCDQPAGVYHSDFALYRPRPCLRVLLGLVSMGLFFDLLWVKNAVSEMQAVFAHNLELFAELAEQLLGEDNIKATRRIRQLRDQINEGFQAVTAQSDAVLLDFSPSRQQKLRIRKDIRRWQPAIRTLLQVQITAVQYFIKNPLSDLPAPVAQAGVGFERDMAQVMRAMASEVSGKPVDAVPDIRLSAAKLQQEIRKYYEERGQQISPQASDVISLAENLASILAPLYEDIHSTFARPQEDVGGLHQYRQGMV